MRSALILLVLLLARDAYSTTSSLAYIPPQPLLPAALTAENSVLETALPTVTVRGFLNFRTTVDGTIIVFTPAQSNRETPDSSSSLKQLIAPTVKPVEIQPTPISATVSLSATKPPELQASSDAKPVYPTGLVTVLGGTVVLNGMTTVYETKVIGTYIDGKYAQILRSSSSIKSGEASSVVSNSVKIEPTKSLSMVSSTVGPELTRERQSSRTLEPSGHLKGESSVQNTRRVRPVRILDSVGKDETKDEENDDKNGNSRSPNRASRRFKLTSRENPRVRLNRFKVKLPSSREKVEEEAAKEINQRFQKRLGIGRSSSSSSSPLAHHHHQSYHRSPSHKSEHEADNIHREKRPEEEPREEEPQELGISEPRYSPPLLEGDIRGETSTVIEPHKVIKQVQTVTSEITQHLNGNQIKVDTVTFTTTVDATLDPSAQLVGGGHLSIAADNNDLDVNTVQETPPIVISRTYSLTERISRTTVVPVYDGSLTTNHTVTESFVIRKMITAYKTMPPGDLQLLQTAAAEMNNASFMLDAIDTSESNLDSNRGINGLSGVEASLLGGNVRLVDPEDVIHKTATYAANPNAYQTLQPSLGFGQQQPQALQAPSLDLNNPLIVGAALRNPALAAMYLGLQNLQQQNHQNQPRFETITRPIEVVTTETLFATKVLSFYDGRATRTRTITEPSAKIEKTVTSLATEVLPKMQTDLLMQQAQLQRAFANQLMNPAVSGMNQLQANDANNLNRFNGNFGSNQISGNGYIPALFDPSLGRGFAGTPQNINNAGYNQRLNLVLDQALSQFNPKPIVVTHTYTTLISATSTDTKIYTLKYNALSTKYRTVTSTSVYPTIVTTTSLATVAQTAAQGFNPFFG